MNTKFDNLLISVFPPFFMFPWIGKDYDKTRVYFVGDSDYSDGVIFHKDWKKDWILESRINNLSTDSRLLNNIDSTMLGDERDCNKRRSLWNSIAFTNLVQRPMEVYEDETKEDPSEEDLDLGWQTILQSLLILKPNVLIKWGIRGDGLLRRNMFNNKYPGWTFENIKDNRTLLLKHESGLTVKMLFTHHPSFKGFSSKRWREAIYETFPELKLLFSIK